MAIEAVGMEGIAQVAERGMRRGYDYVLGHSHICSLGGGTVIGKGKREESERTEGNWSTWCRRSQRKDYFNIGSGQSCRMILRGGVI